MNLMRSRMSSENWQDRKHDRQPCPSASHTRFGFPTVVPSQEVPGFQNQYVPIPSVKISMPQPVPQYNHHETPQYEEKISSRVDKETECIVEELERQLKQIKATDSLRIVNFSDLCIHPGLEFMAKLKCPNFKKYDGNRFPYAYLKVYGVATTQYGNNDKFLLQF